MANILIIDDKPCVRELLKEELASEGYLIETAGDEGSIQRVIRSFKPNLVLLDLYMKGKDRWDVLIDIKQQYQNLPVLIVTAYDDGYRADPRFSMADGFVIKSMYFNELKQKITQILHRKSDFSAHTENESFVSPFPMAHNQCMT